LFDWMDGLSLSYYRAVMRPDADSAALASDFAAVGLDLDVCLEYLRRNPKALEEDPAFWAAMISSAMHQRTTYGGQTLGGTHNLRRLLRKIHAWSIESLRRHNHEDSRP